MRAQYTLLGYADVAVCHAHAACFFNLCREHHIPYTPLPIKEGAEIVHETDVHFRVRLGVWRELGRLCTSRGIRAVEYRRGGIPVLARRYGRRAGLWAGLLVGAILLWLSGQVVWDVRLEPNEAVDMEQLTAQLKESGLAVGTWLPSLETDAVESRLLLCSEDIAWVSINVRGTVAYVQVRELLKPSAQTVDEPQNLVASCDGVVDSVRLLAGDAVVHAGELVRKGQLLISGVVDSADTGYRTAAASGEVWARTEHTLTVEVPRQVEQKVCVERRKGEILLFFFGKTIKVSKSTGIIEGNCDTIKEIKGLTLPGGTSLPISWQTTELVFYEMQTLSLDDAELERRAQTQLRQELLAATQGALLLSKEITSVLTEEGIRMVCQYTCVENIAVPLCFEEQQ